LIHTQRINQRKRVAQEAAELLYTGQEKEYKQAKLRGAENLGVHSLPSNFEVAIELDRIAQEREGKERQERLVQNRRRALQIMQVLEDFNPILVGSVWRGTANRNSDIDIVVYAHNPQQVVHALQQHSYIITETQTQTVTKRGKERRSFHIYVNLPVNSQAEIVVRRPENVHLKAKCEIYGDTIKGLNMHQLSQVLKQNPQRRFLPTRD
jgi:predicted nucleotidyltransferase